MITRIALGGLLVAGCVLSSPAALAETLKSVVVQTLRDHPEVRALLANRRAIGEELEAARGLWRPRADVTSRTGLYADDKIRRKAQHKAEVGVTLSQQIFDGGRADYEISRQKQRVQSADKRIADTANAIALRVIQAYLEVRRSQQAVVIARRNLSALRDIGYRVAKRVRGGRGNPAETSQARARIEAARAALAEARQKVRDAHALYITVTGNAPRKLRRYPLPLRHLPRTVSEAVRQARRHSPKILALQHDALAAESAVGSAGSILMPRLDFEVSADYANHLKYVSNERENLTALVVMRWNLYNGGVNRARKREASFRASEAKYKAHATALNVEREVRLSWNAIKGADERHAALKNQLAHNLRSLSIQIRQFNLRTSTLLDILDTQNEVFVAHLTMTNAAFIAKFSTYRVLAATGRLVHALNIAMPSVDG